MSENKYDDTSKLELKKFLPIFGILLVIIVLVFLVFWGVRTYLDKNKTTNTSGLTAGLIRDYNPVFGKSDSSVKLVYIYDLQCPACKGSNPTLKKFNEDYLSKMQVVYKNFPLPIHGMAKPAAYGSQAVYRQDKSKYLDYKDKIFEQQSQLSNTTVEETAKSLVSDYDKWNSERNSNELRNLIDQDKADVEKLTLPNSQYESGNKISATPSFVIIKDDKIVSWWSGDAGIEELKSRVDKYL